VTHNFQNENNQTKLLKEYERIAQKGSFGNSVYTAVMSGEKYGVIPQIGECSRESNVRSLVSRHLTWQERRACRSCLAFCSIDSTVNKTP
jgi:hypothetical protein